MLILYDLQLSVLTHLDHGQYLMNTDSNVDVASMIIAGLAERQPTWEFLLLGPELARVRATFTDDEYFAHFQRLLPRDRVTRLEVPVYGNPFVERMSFASAELRRKLQSVGRCPDVVWTNDPCKALAYKTMLYHLYDRMVPVVCRVHWVTGKTDRKVPEPIDFAVRQFEGALVSDWITFNSNFACRLFLENATEHFNAEAVAKVAQKIEAIETVDIAKLDRHRPLEWSLFTLPEKIKTILWAHRLSYYTGWQEVFDALLPLWNREPGRFGVIVTDPGDKAKADQSDLRQRWPFIFPIDKTHWTNENYFRVCWDADIAIGNHTYPTIWGGLALTEPMAAYTAPLMPRRASYPEMFWDDGRAYFNTMEEMVERVEAMLSDPVRLTDLKHAARRFCETVLSPGLFLTRIESKLQSIVAGGT